MYREFPKVSALMVLEPKPDVRVVHVVPSVEEVRTPLPPAATKTVP
jgi:hypothetical protein